MNDENCIMTSLICSKNTSELDFAADYRTELEWLNKIKENESFRALVYNQNTNLCKEQIDDFSLNRLSSGFKSIDVIKDNSVFAAYLNNKINMSEKVLLACIMKINNDNHPSRLPPYVFQDKLRNVCYSMSIDGSIGDLNLLFNFAGYIEWLNIYRPDLLINEFRPSNEFFFLWLIKNIHEHDGDVMTGLSRGLMLITNQEMIGSFNLFFSDGTGIYAYSHKGNEEQNQETILYKTIRNEEDRFSYILTNSHDPDDIEWIMIKSNSLYYFPLKGTLKTNSMLNSDRCIVTTEVFQ